MTALTVLKGSVGIFLRHNRHYLAMLVFLALLGAAGWLSFVYERRADDALLRQYTQLWLCEQLVRSSDDLTRAARDYIVTSDPSHRQAFQDILDIRDGRKERPLHYGSGYLRLPKEIRAKTAIGSHWGLLDWLGRFGFTDEELAKLRQAKEDSDRLAGKAFDAMALVTPDAGNEQRARALAMLFEQGYFDAKGRIMVPIYEARDSVARRGGEAYQGFVDQRILWQGIALAAGLLASFFAFRLHRDLRLYAESLRSAQQRLRLTEAIVQSSDNAIISKTLWGVVTSWNRGAEKLFGYAAEEVIGRSITTVFPQERVGEETELLARIARNETVQNFETVRCHKDGRDIHVSVTLSPIRDEHGTIVGVSKIAHDIGWRKTLEKALKEKTALLEIILQNASVGIIFSVNRTITWCNPVAGEIFGYALEELLGKNSQFLYRSDTEYDATGREIYSSLKRGEIVANELRFWHKNGRPLWIRVSASAVDPNAQELQVISVLEDISVRKRAELALEDSNRLLTLSLEAAHLGSFMADLTTKTGVWDERMFDLFDVPVEERANPVTYARWRDPILPQDIEQIEGDLRQATGHGAHLHHEYRILRPNGDIRYLEAWGMVVYNASEKKSQLLGVTLDITGRKLLEQHNAQLATLVQESRDFAAVADVDGKILYLNPAAIRMVGLPNDTDPKTMLISDFVTGESQELFASEILPALFGKGHHEGSLNLLHRDGHKIPVSHSSILHRDSQGRPWFLSTLMRDMRAEKAAQWALIQAKQSAEAANVAKSEFLANMSHEIRTPLNGVISLLQLVGSYSLKPQQASYVQKAYDAANTLLDLLNNILDFSKIEAGKLEIEKSPFSLRRLVTHVSAIMEIAADNKALSLYATVAEDCPDSLIGDEQRLIEVLFNLVANAIKFTERGEVEISVSVASGASLSPAATSTVLRFEVRDTGIGMDQGQLKRIFERFTQVESGSTRGSDGAGLGLSIVHGLVRLMGGGIQVESTLGLGSRFWFRLELERSAAAPASSDQYRSMMPRIALNSLVGFRVLVVEDNPLNQEALASILERMGATVDVAGNGREAVDCVAASGVAYDLVLMDVQMPVMDGIDAARQLRQRYGINGLPIIAITADSQLSTRNLCRQAGMNDFLVKPYSSKDLYCLIHKHCGQVASLVAPPPLSGNWLVSLPSPAGFDLRAAMDRLGNQPATYLTLVRLFLKSIDATLDGLRSQRCNSSADAARKAARILHTLQGSALTLGALGLANAAKSGEQTLTCDDCGRSDKEKVISNLEDAVEQSCATLRWIVERIEYESLAESSPNL